MTLSEFLLARIAEDEAATSDLVETYEGFVGGLSSDAVTRLALDPFLARFDPAYVLAECEAKRRIVNAIESGAVQGRDRDPFDRGVQWAALMLASAYAGHPDYLPLWKL